MQLLGTQSCSWILAEKGLLCILVAEKFNYSSRALAIVYALVGPSATAQLFHNQWLPNHVQQETGAPRGEERELYMCHSSSRQLTPNCLIVLIGKFSRQPHLWSNNVLICLLSFTFLQNYQIWSVFYSSFKFRKLQKVTKVTKVDHKIIGYQAPKSK